MVRLPDSGAALDPMVHGPRGLERKAAIVRGAWIVALLPVVAYLELREKREKKGRIR